MTHASDCITNGFDMPLQGIVHATHCSCSESGWQCRRCSISYNLPANVSYIEHWCPDDVIQALAKERK